MKNTLQSVMVVVQMNRNLVTETDRLALKAVVLELENGGGGSYLF